MNNTESLLTKALDQIVILLRRNEKVSKDTKDRAKWIMHHLLDAKVDTSTVSKSSPGLSAPVSSATKPSYIRNLKVVKPKFHKGIQVLENSNNNIKRSSLSTTTRNSSFRTFFREDRKEMDGSYGFHIFREFGKFGSYPMHDDYGEESTA